MKKIRSFLAVILAVLMLLPVTAVAASATETSRAAEGGIGVDLFFQDILSAFRSFFDRIKSFFNNLFDSNFMFNSLISIFYTTFYKL